MQSELPLFFVLEGNPMPSPCHSSGMVKPFSRSLKVGQYICCTRPLPFRNKLGVDISFLCAQGGVSVHVYLSFFYPFWHGYFLSCLVHRSLSKGFWLSLGENWFLSVWEEGQSGAPCFIMLLKKALLKLQESSFEAYILVEKMDKQQIKICIFLPRESNCGRGFGVSGYFR